MHSVDFFEQIQKIKSEFHNILFQPLNTFAEHYDKQIMSSVSTIFDSKDNSDAVNRVNNSKNALKQALSIYRKIDVISLSTSLELFKISIASITKRSNALKSLNK